MSSQYSIELNNVGKRYTLSQSALDKILDMFGLNRFRRKQLPQFWALRGVNLKVKQGQRLGIIGKNGAGKSTMLKLISQNFLPTEGDLNVNGNVQALLNATAGFHPEFSGYENIQAVLTYQNLSSEEIKEAIEDIREFTELGDFLSQPFKTYSAGMKARLTFATATTIKPEILIVDELLGAGDGYFFSKAIQRMQDLIDDSGATVLIVSHALEHIQRFCDSAVWLDGGQIVAEGKPLDVIRLYQQHLSKLSERRMRSKNSLIQKGKSDVAHVGNYDDQLILDFIGNGIDIASMEFYEKSHLEYSLKVGGVQDSNPEHNFHVNMLNWSEPKEIGEITYRTVQNDKSSIQLDTYMPFAEKDYRFHLQYRYSDDKPATLAIHKNGSNLINVSLPSTDGKWTRQQVRLNSNELLAETATIEFTETSEDMDFIKWSGDTRLEITNIQILNADDEPQLVFETGQTMKFRLSLIANETNSFTVRPAITIYRLDGVCVANQVSSELFQMTLHEADKVFIDLNFENVLFGTGNYVVSPSIFVDDIVEEQRYDLIDRGIEFQINHPDNIRGSGIVEHPSTWQLQHYSPKEQI